MDHREPARDNQWWYSHHHDGDRLDHVPQIILIVEGRRCTMTHSQVGKDGRVTRSFKFGSDADRDFWKGLGGTMVRLQVEYLNVADPRPAASPRSSSTHDVDATLAASRLSATTERLNLRRRTPGLFDAYLFCDWSANSSPKVGKDSIWLADGWFESNGSFVLDDPENSPTRASAERRIRARLLRHNDAGRRTLIGFDFPFGYPEGSVSRLTRHVDAGWRDLWSLLESKISDGPDNRNNRFEIAHELNTMVGERWYWGCPTTKATAYLAETKDGRGDVIEFRTR